ncbi:hypothetical protein GF380_01760 [Candidatus Uhrbacteria bacterium]|nr:hypothetical protein [Candidatus Uhrbacteria bacterium]
MKSILLTYLLITSALLFGAGCFEQTEYVEAPESAPVHIDPNLEGAKASTGGRDATITPQINTAKLVRAFPDPYDLKNTTATEPVERFNPVPLPDGTRTEYTSVERTYLYQKEGSEIRIQTTIIDTRGIPVISAFVDSLTEFVSEDGYRKQTELNGVDAWIQYTYDPEGLKDGFGSFTYLYRERFLIQIDGSLGWSEQELLQFAEAFNYDELN